ncbi:MAG TPA: 16S rRNA (uracil(1498)-N(3))-methyltransferase [Casimicrobiaceae bacterium]|nr:16S rRNA (uracil(1498)-N(3))-methyltransferase [Casimicrobiaceae bacterium]
MSFARFHVQRIAPAGVGDAMVLPDAVAHHATRVLRLDTDATIVLFDGAGGEYVATLERVGRSDANARLQRFIAIERENAHAVTLAQAILASDAMDLAIRKAVELGVARVVPLISERTQRSGALRDGKRHEHWRSIAIAACEQCGRNRVPDVEVPQSFDDYLREANTDRMVAIASPAAPQSLAGLARRTLPDLILIGPEGGFTAREVEHAMARGAIDVNLGSRVLRAETAALAALVTIAAVAEASGQGVVAASA